MFLSSILLLVVPLYFSNHMGNVNEVDWQEGLSKDIVCNGTFICSRV